MNHSRTEFVYLCSMCCIDITYPVMHLKDFSKLFNESKENFLPRGYFAYGHEIRVRGQLPFHSNIEGHEIADEDVIFNIDDVFNVADTNKISGCCGSDASQIHLNCPNGHELGREGSDCWMPHFVCIPSSKLQKVQL